MLLLYLIFSWHHGEFRLNQQARSFPQLVFLLGTCWVGRKILHELAPANEMTACDTLVTGNREAEEWQENFKGPTSHGLVTAFLLYDNLFFPPLEDEPIIVIAQQEGALTPSIVKILITILPVSLCGLVISVINLWSLSFLTGIPDGQIGVQ